MVHTIEHPLEHSDVVTEAWPQELASAGLAEPVDVEDLRQLLRVGALHEGQPVTEVVTHVITAERLHGEGIGTQDAALTSLCRARKECNYQ